MEEMSWTSLFEQHEKTYSKEKRNMSGKEEKLQGQSGHPATRMGGKK